MHFNLKSNFPIAFSSNKCHRSKLNNKMPLTCSCFCHFKVRNLKSPVLRPFLISPDVKIISNNVKHNKNRLNVSEANFTGNIFARSHFMLRSI